MCACCYLAGFVEEMIMRRQIHFQRRVSPIMHIYIAWMSAFKVQPARLPAIPFISVQLLSSFWFLSRASRCYCSRLLFFSSFIVSNTCTWANEWMNRVGGTRWTDTEEEEAKKYTKPKQKCLKHRKHLMIMQNDCIFRRRADCNRHRWACYAFPFRHTANEWTSAKHETQRNEGKKELGFCKGRWLSVLIEKLTHTHTKRESRQSLTRNNCSRSICVVNRLLCARTSLCHCQRTDTLYLSVKSF